MAVKLDKLEMDMLATISDLHGVPRGAYNIRENGKKLDRRTTANIDIVSKTDKDGIDIIIKPGTKNESVHILSSFPKAVWKIWFTTIFM